MWRIMCVMVFVLLVLVQPSFAQQEGSKPELPDLISGLSSEAFPEDWSIYEWNIVAISEVEGLVPLEVWEVAMECDAEYAQVGEDYINIFCPWVVSVQPDTTLGGIEVGNFQQRTIDSMNDGYYLGTIYGAAEYTGPSEFAIRVGMPSPMTGAVYPTIGSSQQVMAYRYSPIHFLSQYAQVFSQWLGREVQVTELMWDEDFASYIIEDGEQYYYYPILSSPAIQLQMFLGPENCTTGEKTICVSDYRLDPENPPTFDCDRGTPILDQHNNPYCYVGDLSELPDGYRVWPPEE